MAALRISGACRRGRCRWGGLLFGYYVLPESGADPIDFVVNPEGNKLRSTLRCHVCTCFSGAMACLGRDNQDFLSWTSTLFSGQVPPGQQCLAKSVG